MDERPTAGLVIGQTAVGDTAVFLRVPGKPDVLLREKCETDDDEWALIERTWATCTREELAQAWDEGYSVGWNDAEYPNHPARPNPHRVIPPERSTDEYS